MRRDVLSRLAGTLFVAVAASAQAAVVPKARIAAPSAGMASDDHILYIIDATELGADKLGRRDSTAAIQQALDACDKETGGTVFLPAGRYRVDGTLHIKGGSCLRGEWVNPEKGGLGKGTILMARAGRGEETPDANPFISVDGAAILRDISVWYPEQSATAPVPYPATIKGRGHSTVFNITLYNSWCGFWNNGCSSMLIRRFYGTPLKLGIHGAYAYDIPRIEHVHFSPRFWAESGLPGAPGGKALTQLKSFLGKNLTCIQGGEQDWGYWWDLDLDTCLRGLYLTAVPDDAATKLVPGNICAGNVKIRNAAVGVFVENAGYPGFLMTYGDISARVCPLYFADRTDHPAYTALGLKQAYQKNSSLVVTDVTFRGGKYSVGSKKIGPYGLNFADCTFTGYSRAAIRSASGSVTATRCRFMETRPEAFELTEAVDQLVLIANEFRGGPRVKGWDAGDPRIVRDDRTPATLPRKIGFTFDHQPSRRPVGRRVWDAADYGVVRGTRAEPPTEDSTAAIQRALDAAGRSKDGGTVYVPAGVYRIDGALRVPAGVELRGCFEGAHYGNGTDKGTQLWVYGGKGNPGGEPAVTLARGSGFKGFTVYYPDHGWTDNPQASEAARVRKYPPTVRTASDCWVQNNTIVCCWTAIDAMTEKSDNLEICDVTGAAMDTTLEYGHGATGGVVRNLHFNYSNWTHQGRFPNRPRNEEVEGSLGSYTGRNVKGLVLGDLRRCTFFSCFNIIVAEQVVLEKDRYTGGSFLGKMWGVAFDAAHNGVVGRAGSEATIVLIASMGVFNQAGGGFYAETDPAFRGNVVFINADVWSGHSRIANVRGGSVTFSQLLSWCCLEAVCQAGGTLNVLGSTYVGDHIGLNDPRDCIRFESGASGSAIGNVDCRKALTITVDPSARAQVYANGTQKVREQK